jgi:hypothetical protein
MATNTPCWAVVPDAANCTSSYMNLTLKIFRGNTTPAPDTHVVSYCVTVTTCTQDSDCGADQKCDTSQTPGTCVENP